MGPLLRVIARLHEDVNRMILFLGLRHVPRLSKILYQD